MGNAEGDLIALSFDDIWHFPYIYNNNQSWL